mmetsp:Transcript_130167/g.417731  ORF Transcript_130167/g.417731 Transcript_130167/m.417731 type:complete len:352 (+) Transcript_130167:86-1141(+)
MARVTSSCPQCCGEGCRYHGRHGSRSCRGCEDAARLQISLGRIPRCAGCGKRDAKGRVDEVQSRNFYCTACWAKYDGDRLVEHFDEPDVLEQKCAALAKMISSARHIIAFTGAGVSTGAGIADFRSGLNTKLPTGPGMWELPKADRQAGNILEQCAQAKPGRAHKSLVRLWKAGLLKHIITQNVDGLHRKSGIPANALSELHGNIFVERCTKCDDEFERDFNVICSGGLTGRHCDRARCGGALRHSGVGFGQDLSEKITDKAWKECERADLCLALGSSITVTPASDMPAYVAERHRGKPDKGLVIANLQSTPCDGQAALRLNGMVDDILERVEAILHEKGVLPSDVDLLST